MFLERDAATEARHLEIAQGFDVNGRPGLALELLFDSRAVIPGLHRSDLVLDKLRGTILRRLPHKASLLPHLVHVVEEANSWDLFTFQRPMRVLELLAPGASVRRPQRRRDVVARDRLRPQTETGREQNH